ncbi:MAG TPA: DUF2218 domain-containing protein [Rhizobiaceae bacterium]|nr:DUF2218 domain-containing protein [Rhizobiaceae bacterium]
MTGQTTSPVPENAARRVALVRTDHASRYLQQLCKHFAHKLPVEFDPERGLIRFAMGDCRLKAEDGGLRLEIEAPNPDDIERLGNVVANHLIRFAFREEMQVEWKQAGSAIATGE